MSQAFHHMAIACQNPDRILEVRIGLPGIVFQQREPPIAPRGRGWALVPGMAPYCLQG